MKTLDINSPKHGQHIAFFDDEDEKTILQYKWFLVKQKHIIYVGTHIGIGRKRKYTLMHRLIMGFPQNTFIDHRDRNGLNNQKSNLRLCDKHQNRHNSSLATNNTTGYKGVIWEKAQGRYRVRLQVKGKNYWGGRLFDDPKEAAKRYNELATKHQGEFAFLNIIE